MSFQKHNNSKHFWIITVPGSILNTQYVLTDLISSQRFLYDLVLFVEIAFSDDNDFHQIFGDS